jgi:hypothetical protein
MNYARNIEGRWIDVYSVPSNVFTDLADLERKLGVTGFTQVPDEVESGDIVVGENGYEKPKPGNAERPKAPVIMTDKQFRKHVQNQLGGGVYGQAFKAASQSTNGDVLDAYAAWSKATTYEKADVAAFTAALVSDGILTSQQRALLVGADNWPEA